MVVGLLRRRVDQLIGLPDFDLSRAIGQVFKNRQPFRVGFGRPRRLAGIHIAAHGAVDKAAHQRRADHARLVERDFSCLGRFAVGFTFQPQFKAGVGRIELPHARW